jgi:hypothetical protein
VKAAGLLRLVGIGMGRVFADAQAGATFNAVPDANKKMNAKRMTNLISIVDLVSAFRRYAHAPYRDKKSRHDQ